MVVMIGMLIYRRIVTDDKHIPLFPDGRPLASLEVNDVRVAASEYDLVALGCHLRDRHERAPHISDLPGGLPDLTLCGAQCDCALPVVLDGLAAWASKAPTCLGSGRGHKRHMAEQFLGQHIVTCSGVHRRSDFCPTGR